MSAKKRRMIGLDDARLLREIKRCEGLTWVTLAERSGRDRLVVRAAVERLEAVEAARAGQVAHNVICTGAIAELR
jgi:hypothetical protein